MGASNTKELLIDVARQLFAKLGIDGTTMNDIAVKSNKGRRTLYTYFKSKDEVYEAVVEKEIDRVINNIRSVCNINIPTSEKLRMFVDIRMKSLKEIVSRNGSLRAFFFRDANRVEGVRRRLYDEELKIITLIFEEGNRNGSFDIKNVEITAKILQHALKGFDIPYIKGVYRRRETESNTTLGIAIDILLNGIVKRN